MSGLLDKDVTTEVSPSAATASQPSFRLTVTTGREKGRSVVLGPSNPARVLIGQSEVCDLRLSDREVSRRHTALEHVGRALRVTDLASTNGTFVDRVRVVEALLAGGELVRVGTTVLRVDLGAEAEPGPPLPSGTSF